MYVRKNDVLHRYINDVLQCAAVFLNFYLVVDLGEVLDGNAWLHVRRLLLMS